MAWVKTLTRELPFLTIDRWRYAYSKGWPKLLGFGLLHVVYHSKRNIVAVYRKDEVFHQLIKDIEQFILKAPEKMLAIYKELEELDRKVEELTHRKIAGKDELKKYLQEIDEFLDYYCTVYLTKTYSGYALTDEVKKKAPEVVSYGHELIKKAAWFSLCKAIAEKTSQMTGFPEKTLSMFTIKELIAIVESGKADAKLAEKRFNGFAWDLDANKYYWGEEGDRFIASLHAEQEVPQTNELKGMVAQQGYAKGKAVIVLGSADFNKITEGCIVVAHQTTPWYNPYLGKVAAIVTDEGGVGTHAAIIARELKKPCIMATRFATKVFKDNDMIEVDAEKGTVKKVLMPHT